MNPTSRITASEAKAKFSELLDRVKKGESFYITLHGEEAAKIVPVKRPSLEEIQEAISRLKSGRSVLNPPGKERLELKDLIGEGRH